MRSDGGVYFTCFPLFLQAPYFEYIHKSQHIIYVNQNFITLSCTPIVKKYKRIQITRGSSVFSDVWMLIYIAILLLVTCQIQYGLFFRGNKVLFHQYRVTIVRQKFLNTWLTLVQPQCSGTLYTTIHSQLICCRILFMFNFYWNKLSILLE